MLKKSETETHNIYKIFGISFKFKKRTQQDFEQKKRQNLYNFVENKWCVEGATESLIFFLEYLKWIDKKQYSKELDLIYISCLLETKQYNVAEIALNMHIKKYGEDLIEDFLPVANFAHKKNLTNNKIEKAAIIFEKLEYNNKNGVLEKYLNGKTIAIVGNSPKELNTQNGQKIDKYDVVIRMNDFSIEDEFIKDYGSKVNIWVSNSNYATMDPENRKNAELFDWIFIPYDFWHMRISSFSNIDLFLDYYDEVITNNFANIAYFTPQSAIEFRKKSGIALPSSGCIAQWHFGNISDNLDKYGITDTEQPEDTSYTYYFNAKNYDPSVCHLHTKTSLHSTYFKDKKIVAHGHNLNAEIKFINKINGDN